MAVRSLPPYTSNRPDYHYITDVPAFVAAVLENPPNLIAVDTETYYNPDLTAPQSITKWINGGKNNCPFGVSLYWGDNGYWIDHDIRELQPLLEDISIQKILHNSKYDMMMLKNVGIKPGGVWNDTMIMIQLIDENMECKYIDSDGETRYKKSKKLKDLAFHFLDGDAHELEDLVAEYRSIIAANKGLAASEVSYKDVSDANHELMKDYAVADTEFCYRLYPIFKAEMDKQELWRAYNIDINATRVVLDIERAGYRVDQQLMRRYETELTIVSQRRRELAYTIAGKEFNLNSDAELVDVFKHLGVEWHWFTAKEEYQTDKRIMKYLTGDTNEKVAQLAQAVLDYRKAEKMLSTYITGLFQYIQEDGKVHCDFWISPDDFGRGGTSTGRMSSSNPNFQNIPKKSFKLDEFEFNIRNIFVADEGYTLVFQDANAEEYRMLGHYGQDEKFMQFIREGKDIHKATAAMVFNIPYDDVTDEQRAVGKTTNFG